MKMRWAGYVAHKEAKRMHIGFWWEIQKRSLGRPRRRWEDNIKMNRMSDMDWIDVAQDRDQWRALVNTVTNLRVP
jgi:hypothetical protein